MAKSEYELLLETPHKADASAIAATAHARVYDFLDSLIEDENIPETAREELEITSISFAGKVRRKASERELR